MKGDALSRLLVGSEGFWFHHVRVIMFDDAKNQIENSVSNVGNKLLVVYYLFFTRSTTILIFLQNYNVGLGGGSKRIRKSCQIGVITDYRPNGPATRSFLRNRL